MKYGKILLIFVLLAVFSVLSPADGKAETRMAHLKGQAVYVPIYSHIYSGNKNLPFYLTATLSIRNTDFHHPITITMVDYYDSSGKLLKKYIEKPVPLNAMASTRYIVQESDKTGGSGANFVVRWTSGVAVSAPLIESVMISTKSSQGVSFTSRGQVIQEVFE
ncbi:MAG: DUF3124 domain-containing protein [Desulfobacteraceae bacterium]|nr:MAG: DUF3124 domain-containing protein [Desulfobacteraceae bacterium]